jgi:hypothetical protein
MLAATNAIEASVKRTLQVERVPWLGKMMQAATIANTVTSKNQSRTYKTLIRAASGWG